MPTDGGREKFARLIEALRPALGQLIIVGGWAHRLYRLRPESSSPDYDPLFTNDTDIAIGKPSPPTATPNLKTRLLEHGFKEEFLGEDKPRVTHFHLKDSNFYAEFLTPLSTLGPLWTDTVQETLSVKAAKELVAARLRLFDQPNDDVRRAATIAADRPLDAAILLARCQAGLDDILGPS